MGRVISSILTLTDNFSNTISNVNKNTRSFQNEILHAQNSVERFRDKAVSSFTSVLSKASLLAGGLGFVEMAKKSIEFASDLSEVQNVVDVTFGDMNKQINDWSKNAINKYGENELQAKNFASTFGAMLKSGGVTGQDLVKYSEMLSGYVGDLSSFRNLKLDESFEKIRSAISGESEPMKSLGYDISDTAVQAYALSHGIGAGSIKMKEASKTALDVEVAQKKYNDTVKKYGQTSLEARQKAEALQKVMKGTQPTASGGGSGGNLTQAEKLQARLGLIQDLLKDVNGDFVRTKGSFANQARIAQSQFMELGKTIGTKVLPSLTTFLGSLTNGAIGRFGDAFVKEFDSIGKIITNIKPNLENLWNSIAKFSKNVGITDFFKNMFSGNNNKLINETSYILKVVIDSVASLINVASAHPDAVKAIFSGVIGALAGLKVAEGAIGVLGFIKKVQKASEGLSGIKKVGNIFSTIFKLPPQALVFIAIVGLIAGAAYLIYKNWKPISTWFKQVGAEICAGFTFAVNWFESLPSRFWNSAVNTFKWFKDGAWSIISGIGQWVADKFNDFVTFFVNLPTNALTWGSDIVHSIKNGIVNTIDDAVDGAKQLSDAIVKKVKEFFGIHSPSKVFYGIGGYLVQGLINGMNKTNIGSFISKWIGNISSDASGAVGGNVSDWITQALNLTGTDGSWLNGMLRLASYESGDPGKLGTGNPTLVNNIPVGNEFATGLMQMLPSTFKQFQLGGLGDIKNPIHNIAASIQYIKRRYGSVYNTPLFTSGGSYMGYATGTNYAKSGIGEVAENGAELVLGRHYKNFKGGEKVVDANDTSKLLNNNDGTNVYVIIQGNVLGNEEYAHEVGRTIINEIKLAKQNM